MVSMHQQYVADKASATKPCQTCSAQAIYSSHLGAIWLRCASLSTRAPQIPQLEDNRHHRVSVHRSSALQWVLKIRIPSLLAKVWQLRRGLSCRQSAPLSKAPTILAQCSSILTDSPLNNRQSRMDLVWLESIVKLMYNSDSFKSNRCQIRLIKELIVGKDLRMAMPPQASVKA